MCRVVLDSWLLIIHSHYTQWPRYTGWRFVGVVTTVYVQREVRHTLLASLLSHCFDKVRRHVSHSCKESLLAACHMVLLEHCMTPSSTFNTPHQHSLLLWRYDYISKAVAIQYAKSLTSILIAFCHARIQTYTMTQTLITLTLAI